MRKPRVYWSYYPKLKRGYWRVSPINDIWRPTNDERVLWIKAHIEITRTNDAAKLEARQ